MLENKRYLAHMRDPVTMDFFYYEVCIDDEQFYDGATPTEAILKALCHQEGVEVE